MSRLAETGASQPYRAADIEALKNLPTQARTPDMAYAPVASHIGPRLRRMALTLSLRRMRSEGGVDVTLTQTAVAFAAAGLRRATGAENLTVSAMVDGTRMTYADPDYLRLSAVKGVEGDGPSDLDIRVLDSGHLTSVVLGGAIQPVLAVSRNAQTFHLTLTFTEGTPQCRSGHRSNARPDTPPRRPDVGADLKKGNLRHGEHRPLHRRHLACRIRRHTFLMC